MEWKDLSGILTKVAPTIATALGGPLAGGAVMALEGVFGLNTEGSTKDKQEALVAALSGATPDQLLALKKADQDYAVKMEELGIKREELAGTDRDSARKRESEVKDKTPRNLAYLIVGSFLGVVIGVIAGWGKIDSVLAGTLIGYLSAKAEQVATYYYGSNVSSIEKTKLLAASTPPAAK
jgi:hypothetical protein